MGKFYSLGSICGAAALALTTFSCNEQSHVKIAIPSDPKGTVEVVVKHIAKGQPAAVWAALPSSYQSDVTELVHEFGAKVDGELYNEVFDLARRISALLKTKKDFILGHPMVAAQLDAAEVSGAWDSIVGMFDTLVNSDLAHTSKLQSIDIAKFLQTDGASFMQHLVVASKLSDEGSLESLAQVQVEQVGNPGEVVKLKVTIPGKPAETIKMKQVDGRWLPVEIIAAWDRAIAKGRKNLAEMAGPDKQTAMQAKMALGMASAVVGQLEQASTQDEFNEVVQGLMGMGGFGARPGR